MEMADYKRMVSYLYKYKNGAKGENVGYVRVERMNGDVKFVVRMRDAQGPDEIPMQICLYYKDGDVLAGIPCGSMELVHGEGEYKGQTRSAHICGSDKRFEDISGMVVYYNQEMAYGTQWDAVPLVLSSFSWKKEAEGETGASDERDAAPRVEEAGTEAEDGDWHSGEPDMVSVKEMQMEPDNRTDPQAYRSGTQNGRSAQAGQNQFVDQLLGTLGQGQAWAGSETPDMEQGQTANENTDFSRIRDAARSREQDQWEQEEAERGPNTQPMWGNQPQTEQSPFREVDRAVQNNPRLPNMEGSIIGIPGVYSRENEYLASLFGFQKFLPLRGMPVHAGAYGYWIRPLQQ